LIHAETRIAAPQTQPEADACSNSMPKLFEHERLRDGDVECLEDFQIPSLIIGLGHSLDLVQAGNHDGRSLDLTARSVPHCEMKDDT
jgi:hypothetical protein